MILLDSCAVLEILLGGVEAELVSTFLDTEQNKGTDIIFLNLCLLESSTVVAVRFKEKRLVQHDLKKYLTKLAAFQTFAPNDDLTQELILMAAQIKAEHAASMVDCYLIANALYRKARIITSDPEILGYNSKRAKVTKVSKQFSTIKWSFSA